MRSETETADWQIASAVSTLSAAAAAAGTHGTEDRRWDSQVIVCPTLFFDGGTLSRTGRPAAASAQLIPKCLRDHLATLHTHNQPEKPPRLTRVPFFSLT